MTEIIAWVIVIVVSIVFSTTFFYSFGEKTVYKDGKFVSRNTFEILVNGFINFSIVMGALVLLISALTLVVWAFQTAKGA
jgi:hypothetical protein